MLVLPDRPLPRCTLVSGTHLFTQFPAAYLKGTTLALNLIVGDSEMSSSRSLGENFYELFMGPLPHIYDLLCNLILDIHSLMRTVSVRG